MQYQHSNSPFKECKFKRLAEKFITTIFRDKEAICMIILRAGQLIQSNILTYCINKGCIKSKASKEAAERYFLFWDNAPAYRAVQYFNNQI